MFVPMLKRCVCVCACAIEPARCEIHMNTMDAFVKCVLRTNKCASQTLKQHREYCSPKGRRLHTRAFQPAYSRCRMALTQLAPSLAGLCCPEQQRFQEGGSAGDGGGLILAWHKRLTARYLPMCIIIIYIRAHAHTHYIDIYYIYT
jgi:hypothetical protein